MKISKRTLQVLALASSLCVLSGAGVSVEPRAPATAALGIQTPGEPRAPSIELHADSTEQRAVSTEQQAVSISIREAHSDGGYWYYR